MEMAHKWVTDFKRSTLQPEVQENTVINDANGQEEIEHSSTCIYCGEAVRLMEAEVVYMHNKCRVEAHKHIPTSNTSTDIQTQT